MTPTGLMHLGPLEVLGHLEIRVALVALVVLAFHPVLVGLAALVLLVEGRALDQWASVLQPTLLLEPWAVVPWLHHSYVCKTR